MVPDATTNILVTGICKHYHGEAAQRRSKASPVKESQFAIASFSIPFNEMYQHKHDKVSYSNECNETRVFQRVQTSEEGYGYDDEPMPSQKLPSPSKESAHENSHPKVPVYQKSDTSVLLAERSNHAWHQVSNDDEIADTNAEAFDSNRRVEEESRRRVCHL